MEVNDTKPLELVQKMKRIVRNGERRPRLMSKKANNSKQLKCHLKQAKKEKLAKTKEVTVPNTTSAGFNGIQLQTCELIQEDAKEQIEEEEPMQYSKVPEEKGFEVSSSQGT